MSTAHVTREEGAALARNTNYPITGQLSGGYGTLIHLSDDYNAAEFKKLFTSFGLLPATAELLNQLRCAGFQYVIFDADGPVVDGLPTFEW
jgi:hypothetical protein